MQKIYSFFLLFLTVTFTIQSQTYPTTSWSDNTDITWYDANQNTFTFTTAEELAGLSELVADGNTFAGKTINIGADIDLNAHLWVPIGIDNNFLFSGIVNGGNYTISNLWINQPNGDWIGLFGQTSGASFSNIKLDTANVLALDTSGILVANLATNSSMQDCHVTNGSIIATSYNIGGLTGGVLTNSTMTRCTFSGSVVGFNQVGGLAGTAWNNSVISESYSEGTVSGDFLVGGLVGYCTFSFGPPTTNVIDNCYSRAIVSANTGRAGGLYGGSDTALVLRNSYATGSATAPEYAGAILGAYGNGIVIENTFFDTNTSGLTEGVGGFTGAPGGYDIEGRATVDMKTTELLNLLNAGSATNPWALEPSLNDGYPVLTSLLSTKDDTFETLNVAVYPTIFTNNMTVSSTITLESFNMYSVSGAFVLEGDLENTNTIQAGNLSAGIYILNINTSIGIFTKKVIKK